MSESDSAKAEGLPKAKKKRMLEVSQLADGRTLICVNYSSLEMIQTCPRKAFYSLVLGLQTEEEAAPLAFGSAMHKGLEHWYLLPLEQRQLSVSEAETAAMYAFGTGLQDEACGALESIRQFCLRGWSALHMLPDDDKRSLSNGVKIMHTYFKQYLSDGLTVACNSSGPIVERECEATLLENEKYVVRYHGTIDVALTNAASGLTMIADHKTTHQLGNEFYQRCKPNPQYTGYVWLAQECLGIETNLFMVNGIQVAKTKHEFARQVTSRDENDVDELRSSVQAFVIPFVEEMHLHGLGASYRDCFPQAAPNPCSMYGGCQWRSICEVPEKLKKSVMNAKWRTAG